MNKRRTLVPGIERRTDRGTVRARIMIHGRRVTLGEWPDTPDGISAATATIDKAKLSALVGTFQEPKRVTVEDYYDVWLERRSRMVAKGALSVRGHEDDFYHGRRFVPRIGKIRLVDLTVDDVDRLAVDLLDNGRIGGGPLAAQTVTNTLKGLRKMLSNAVEDGILPRNVATRVRVGRPDDERAIDDDGFDQFDGAPAWTRNEIATLLASTDGLLRPMVIVAAATGLRRSELCGLSWRNVDLERGILRVRSAVVMEANRPILRQRTKSYSSRRTIALPNAAVTALRARRAAQAKDRLAAGNLWGNDAALVFTWDDGRLVSPGWLSRQVTATAVRCGVKPLSSHGLRHTFATLALEEGVPITAVSKALGHADVGVTAATYSHVTEHVARDAAAKVGAAIFGE